MVEVEGSEIKFFDRNTPGFRLSTVPGTMVARMPRLMVI